MPETNAVSSSGITHPAIHILAMVNPSTESVTRIVARLEMDENNTYATDEIEWDSRHSSLLAQRLAVFVAKWRAHARVLGTPFSIDDVCMGLTLEEADHA